MLLCTVFSHQAICGLATVTHYSEIEHNKRPCFASSLVCHRTNNLFAGSANKSRKKGLCYSDFYCEINGLPGHIFIIVWCLNFRLVTVNVKPKTEQKFLSNETFCTKNCPNHCLYQIFTWLSTISWMNENTCMFLIKISFSNCNPKFWLKTTVLPCTTVLVTLTCPERDLWYSDFTLK